jgi:hypothetical protein
MRFTKRGLAGCKKAPCERCGHSLEKAHEWADLNSDGRVTDCSNPPLAVSDNEWAADMFSALKDLGLK